MKISYSDVFIKIVTLDVSYIRSMTWMKKWKCILLPLLKMSLDCSKLKEIGAGVGQWVLFGSMCTF